MQLVPCSYGRNDSQDALGSVTAEATGSELIRKELVLFLIQQVNTVDRYEVWAYISVVIAAANKCRKSTQGCEPCHSISHMMHRIMTGSCSER